MHLSSEDRGRPPMALQDVNDEGAGFVASRRMAPTTHSWRSLGCSGDAAALSSSSFR